MKGTFLLLYSMLISALLLQGQNYSEPPDLPNTMVGVTASHTFTLVAGSNTFDGEVESPSDLQDNYSLVVPIGKQIDSISYCFADTFGGYSGFIRFDTASSYPSPLCGLMNVAYPVGPGTYTAAAVANFAVSVDWTMVAYVSEPCNLPNGVVVTASPAAICDGGSATLTVAGNLNDATLWKIYAGSCGGSLIGSGNSIVVSPTATTTYLVRGEGACVPPGGSCDSASVVVNTCANLSETQPLDLQVSVFPNPVREKLLIELGGNVPKGAMGLKVLDVLGIKVMEQNVEMTPRQSLIELSTLTLPEGTYILQLQMEKNTISKRFIVCRR